MTTRQQSCRLGLVAAGGIVLFLLTLACNRRGTNGESGDVVIRIVGSSVQSGSNVVTFLITNSFEFPLRYAACVQTKDGTQVWRPIYSSGRSITLLRGQIEGRGTTTFSWVLPPTNRWKIEVSYNDPRPSSFGQRVQGHVSSSEMSGGALIAPAK